MRQQGSKDNTEAIKIGIMDSDKTCKIGELKLSEDDLLVAEHLKTGYHKSVNNSNPALKNEETFAEPLKEGDTIALYRVNDEQYIIIGKLVCL